MRSECWSIERWAKKLARSSLIWSVIFRRFSALKTRADQSVDESSPNSSPSFWAYLQGEGEIADPMFALRLYGDAKDFGVSLEVSFIERKKDEESLQKAEPSFNSSGFFASLLFRPNRRCQPTIPRNEANRLETSQGVEAGQVRKVLVKVDVNLS